MRDTNHTPRSDMSTKRKRLIEAVESSPPEGTPTAKKRKGRISQAEKLKINEEMKKVRVVFDAVKQHRGTENRDITEHFLRAPSRRADPEYYKLITEPIDLTRIQQKLNTTEYRTFEEFCQDVELLVDNSKAYYEEDSEEYRDASILYGIFEDARQKVENGLPVSTSVDEDDHEEEDGAESHAGSSDDARSVSSGRASRSSTTSDDAVESIMVDDIICGILELTDGTGRLISPPFRVLQSKEEFPIYYEKIKDPIDLKRIAEKARSGQYTTMQEVETDIRLLCRNAQKFSGKGSEIYRDASALVDFFKDKRDHVLEKGVHCKRREKVVRVVDGLLKQSSSSYGSEAYSEDSEEDGDSEESDDAKWQLYWTLRNEPDDKEKGMCLSDPFLELPSRSCYPDYYDDIKKPMSFFMINKKMKRSGYDTLSELVLDCMQVFENACEYNIEGSAYYVAAKKLEELTLRKARQLQPSIDLAAFDKKLKPKAIPKPKTPKTIAKVDPGDSSSDEKDTPPPQKKPRSPRKSRPISTGMSSDNVVVPGKPGRKSMDELMLRYRQKLMSLWDVIYNHKDSNDYWPAGAFVDLPSARDYPDYYQCITQPIDLKMIRAKIENNKYDTSEQVLSDMRLMFANARRFNEPGSAISVDAKRLEELVMNDHASRKDAPFESPVFLKQKFGWLKTKLPDKKRGRASNGCPSAAVGGLTPSQFSLSNGYYGLSDDESSNSSIRSPAPSLTTKTPKMKMEKKFDESRLSSDQKRMWNLLRCIRDYVDEDGRKLSSAFVRLPTREEYPNYYEVIKKPMDLQRIQQRLNGQGYASWNDIVHDLGLMLDNACKYNETGSDIYKDAVSLQRVLLEKKRELGAADETMPQVQVEIRTMFTNIFGAVFSKKDIDGRCRSDSFADLPDLLKGNGVPQDEWPFSFDQIKRNIDKCRYRRLDRFQKDFFDLFEKALEHAKVDSKLFEDAAQLQVAFLRERDAQCKNILISNAFTVIEKDVLEEVELVRKRRSHDVMECMAIEKHESTDDIAKMEGEVELSSLTVKGEEYTVPSYVYVARTDDCSKGLPHIMRIERMFRNETGDEMVSGSWVYRPSETLHLPNRRFIKNEVFLTPFQNAALAERLLGKCQVVHLKSYLANEIKGVDASHLFVCESRYLGKPRYFVKMKSWPHPSEEDCLEMTPRSRQLSPVRNASEFVKAENDTEDLSSQASSSSEEDVRLRDSFVLDIDRPEVRARGDADADGRVFFYQMCTQSGKHYACGDFVLVFNPQKSYCDVMRIDKLWRDQDGSEWFSGGWFARPSDIKHDLGKMFYKREVFAVNQADQTRRVDDIQTHCAVLLLKEYIKERPTEIPECDVFICENRVNGQPLAKGELSSIFVKPVPGITEMEEDSQGEPMHIDCTQLLRKMKPYKNGPSVVDAEVYVFKAPLTMEKEMSPLLKNDMAVPLDPLDIDMLDENDTDGNESVSSCKPGELNTWLAAQPKLTAKSKSGYILFSAEVRKRIMHENPEAGFGEVSKIVGIEWKKLSEDQKRQYEVRAEYIATERAKQEAARALLKEQLQPGQQRVHQCRWSNCDSQFDQENGLYEHIVQHHTSQIILDSENQYVCMWVTCLRNRKDGKPFPSLPRLHRHMKEKHLPNSGRSMYQNQLGRNFYRLISTQSPSGENYQLVHYPYGRAAGSASNSIHQNQPQTPQQPVPQVNGHHQMNGEHHYSAPAPHMLHAQQAPQQAYVSQASSSQAHQQHPGQAVQNSVHPHHQQQSVIADPGRALVKMPPGAEPVFVHAPSSFMSKRVLHSDTYLRYIESLGSNRQRSVSSWERSMAANSKNTHPKKQLPGHWIKQVQGREVASEEDVVRSLWRLRDQIMESSLGVSGAKEYTGQL